MAKSFSGWLWRAVIVMAVLVLPLHHTHAGGAIAIGPCAAFGYAFDYPDIAEAQAVALAKCSQDSRSRSSGPAAPSRSMERMPAAPTATRSPQPW